MSVRTKNLLLYAGVAVFCVFAVVLFANRHQVFIQDLGEDISYHFDPTPERAFAYGMRHFNALSPQEYDIDRATYFYRLTIESDPKFPMVHHELARIAFLKGSYSLALNLIDEEMQMNPHADPSTYYVKALIEGYLEHYADAAKDYEHYFKITPANWAGINDYSWVLLKANRAADAHRALTWGLKQWPDNAWLLSNDATALYELGRYSEAAVVAKKAVPAVEALTVGLWLNAYPGNDPLIAQTGLDAFKKTTQENLTKILAKAK
jgi:tetratricopeptide (TPR) repeat protein